jgi:glycosyltransferase involved in cell wall biosynthesis
MKILQLSPQYPFPEIEGGKIGIASIYKELSRLGADITLVSYSDKVIEKKYLDEGELYGKVLIINHSTENTKSRILKSVVDSKPLYLRKHFNKTLSEKFKQIATENNFDIVHSDHSSMAEAALFVKNLIKIPAGLRLHNIEWKIWKRYSDEFPIYHPSRIYLERQARILKNYESYYYSKFDVCYAITDNDKIEALNMAQGANVKLASAGVNLEEWKPQQIDRNPNELIIAATYGWVHNVKAVKWLIENVLPIIKKEVPDIKFTIIGLNPPEFFNNYKELGVEVKGFVDKVQPYLNKASIYVAPLFVGSGIRIKILEAMAMELPVIATTISAEGIDAIPADGLLVADKAEDYAELILKLIRNPQLAREFGKSARKFIENNYTWKKNVGVMYNEYSDLMRKGRI